MDGGGRSWHYVHAAPSSPLAHILSHTCSLPPPLPFTECEREAFLASFHLLALFFSGAIASLEGRSRGGRPVASLSHRMTSDILTWRHLCAS